MGLNRLMSLSKNSVLPDTKPISVKGSKIAVKKIENCENRKEKCVAQGKDLSGDVSSQKIDKTSKNLKIATTAKKSMIWNTLRITNKNKSAANKGKLWEILLIRSNLDDGGVEYGREFPPAKWPGKFVFEENRC